MNVNGEVTRLSTGRAGRSALRADSADYRAPTAAIAVAFAQR